MRSDVEQWRDAFEEMYRLTVIPRRSIDRIRRALADGRPDLAEHCLTTAEGCLAAAADLYLRMDDTPAVCPHCLGSGQAQPPVSDRGTVG